MSAGDLLLSNMRFRTLDLVEIGALTYGPLEQIQPVFAPCAVHTGLGWIVFGVPVPRGEPCS